MKKIFVVATVMISLILIGSLAFGNPGMLPKHPGYPMAETKDPVLGVPTANDPGEAAPLPGEALKQAAEYHDAQSRNVPRDQYPNIVHENQPGMSDSKKTKPQS